jgi:twitching motility protein PilT
MRDLPTIEFTVIAAETGHLVFGTVHTVSAATTVDRIVAAFPPGQQQQVRSTLADSLRAVICQYLMKEKSGPGRVLAVELMINNEAVSNLIRKGKAFQLPSVISTSREQGMQLMDTDLMRLLKEGKITAEDAYVKAVSKKEFESLVDEEEKMQAVKKAPGARVRAAASRPAQGDGADGAPRPAQPTEPGARKPAVASTPPAARKP